LAVSGQGAEARQVIAELLKLAQQSYLPPYPLAIVYAGLGEKDEAFAWLEKAYAEREAWMTYLNVYPVFDPLRSDARFAESLRRVGLAQ
jgi:Tfp pilus assembly protein PilF